MTSQNNKANYYVYDVFNPNDFKDKKEYSDFVLSKFLEWQKRYLD